MPPTTLARRVPISHVLAQRGCRLTRRGSRLTAPCPIHAGDNPGAFVVDPLRNLWYCFTACRRGGDVIDLVCLLDRCDFREALRRLDTGDTDFARPDRRIEIPAPPSWRPYTRALPLDPTDDWLGAKGIRPDTARAFGVGRYDGLGFLYGCIGVRLHDADGNPLGYAGRRLDPTEAGRRGKWKFPPAFPKGRTLYSLHRTLPYAAQSSLVLVECPWGVMRLAQLGVPAVALLGTCMTDVHVALLQGPRKLILLLDGDRAGRRATLEILQRLATRHQPPTALHLPDGLDPDDLSDAHLLALLAPSVQPTLRLTP